MCRFLAQTLDLSQCPDEFCASSFSSLVELRTLSLCGCANSRRAALLSLPVGVTSLALDDCEQLEVDDDLLSKVIILQERGMCCSCPFVCC